MLMSASVTIPDILHHTLGMGRQRFNIFFSRAEESLI